MYILWLDAFHGGSHAAVARGYAAHSCHQVELLTLPQTGGWRWRMRGAAVTFARMLAEHPRRPDLFVATDMLDLATFRALLNPRLRGVPTALYCHENQLTYPLPAHRARDLSFAWTNYTSALAADALFFNSAFHQRSFLAALPELLRRFHDYQELENVAAIAAKSALLPPGIALRELARSERLPPQPDSPPVLLWNSRWDYDKDPPAFFAALEALAARGVAFKLIVAGEHIDPNAAEFVAARARWAAQIVHWGYAADRAAYGRLLQRADIVVSTAIQEFFGIGVVEALACGCIPVLPQRLAYPELLPAAYHADCLYTTPTDLVERLHDVIDRRAELSARPWPAIAAAYDWAVLAPRYDTVFASLSTEWRERDEKVS